MKLLSGFGISALSLVCACKVYTPPSGTASDTARSVPPESSVSHYVDGGDSLRFVSHEENLPPGFPMSANVMTLTNPYEHDKQAMATGGKLFVAYNCIDCHGADGSGAMGPSFADGRWHFGGTPAEVFESIYEGRPDGMPAWGGRISNGQIWMLTAYVRSLSAKDLSTENFTGKTIERTGH
ncbi:MAG: c-type cytochrome [Gemmatimonadota bacterium]|nr:c-type cytochrome [Gemmatimonadota bacterium]